MAGNDLYSSSTGLFPGYQVPESVRSRILAAQLLGQAAAASNQPFTSRGILFAKAAAGLLSGLSEGSAIRGEEAAQADHRTRLAALVTALQTPQGAMGAAPGLSSPQQPPSPQAGAPTGTGAGSAASYLGRVAGVESGGNPSASASSSSAQGLYQITGPTWANVARQHPELALTPDGRSDPAQQQRAATALTSDNAAALGHAGFAATPGNLYLAHFAGPGGATAALGADPSTPVEQVLGPQAVAANPFLRGKTAGDLVGWANGKMAGVDPSTVPGAPARTADLPAPNANPTGATSLPPGVTPDMIGPRGALNPTVLAGPSSNLTMDPAKAAVLAAALRSGGAQGALPQVPGPSGPDQPPNATDYALSPTGTRDTYAPSVQVGGIPAADANEGSKPVTFDPSMLGPSTSLDADGNEPLNMAPVMGGLTPPLPQSAPLPPPGAQSMALAAALRQGAPDASQSQPPLPQSAPAAPSPDASAMAPAPPPAPAQQAIASAVSPSPQPMSAPPPPAAGPSVPPQALAAALAQGGTLAPPGRGVDDPASPQAFNAQQGGGASPGVLASLLRGGQPVPPAPSVPPAVMAQALDPSRAPQQAPPAPQGMPPQGAGVFGGLGSLLGLVGPQPAPVQPSGPLGGSPANPQQALQAMLSDPRTSPQEAQFILSRALPQFQYEKTDNGNIVRVDPRGIVPPDFVYQGGKYASTRNGVIYNEGTGAGPGGATAGANGFRPATAQERSAYGVADGRPMYMGPGGEPHFGEPETTTQGETAEARTAGEAAAQRRNAMLAAADDAPDKIARMRLLGTVLDRTKTGPLSEEIGNATAIAQRLGISNDRLAALGIDPNGPVNNAVANKLAGELVVGSIGAKGGGFPASNFSVAERQFLEGIYPNIENQPGANDVVKDVMVAGYQRAMQKADEWADFKQQARKAGKALNYEDFEDSFRQAHAGDNIFAPIIQKYQAGGYTPYTPGADGASAAPGAPPPQQGVPAGQSAAPVQVQTPDQARALPPGTVFITPDGRRKVR